MQVKLLNIKDLYLRKSWFKPFLSKKQDGNRLRTGELINPIRSALSISIILSVRNRLFSSIQRLKPCIHRVYSRPLPMNFNSFHKSYTPALRNSPACIFSIKTRRNASFWSVVTESSPFLSAVQKVRKRLSFAKWKKDTSRFRSLKIRGI